MLDSLVKYVLFLDPGMIEYLLTSEKGGMLSLEGQVIDATTEEGQQALKEFEEQEKTAAAEAKLAENYADDPE